MTDTTAQEPTMEEILASIRRIISEDDAPAAEAAPAPEPEPVEEASPALMDETPSVQEPEAEEEILDLTDRYEAPAAQTIGDLDVTAPADEPEPEPFPTSFAEPERPAARDPEPSASSVPYDSLVGESAAAASASAFAGLSAAFRQPEPIPTGGVGPTIDDLARSLLRPMLKDWLDANLPGIVEAAVKKEVERISRSAG
ncbi:DUF2497 domain-containing protein [Brevundimonas sp.]|uniref:DUF2497 domain-containing protein n=1 Tax=Brevundimonas sp. TaxID=1871086 RepID=UPI00286C7DE3|nr:DUF2497 domain-containing protein [Brevundimonas sp.]